MGASSQMALGRGLGLRRSSSQELQGSSLITCQFPGKTVSAGGVRSKQAAGEAMGLREVGAPLARPRHTWETGGGKGKRAAVSKRAEGGRTGS